MFFLFFFVLCTAPVAFTFLSSQLQSRLQCIWWWQPLLRTIECKACSVDTCLQDLQDTRHNYRNKEFKHDMSGQAYAHQSYWYSSPTANHEAMCWQLYYTVQRRGGPTDFSQWGRLSQWPGDEPTSNSNNQKAAAGLHVLPELLAQYPIEQIFWSMIVKL